MSHKLIRDSFKKRLKDTDFSARDDFAKEKTNEPGFSPAPKTTTRKMPRQSGPRKSDAVSDLSETFDENNPFGCGPLEDKG